MNVLLLLNGGNPWDELLMLGIGILIAFLIARLSRRKEPDDEESEDRGTPKDS